MRLLAVLLFILSTIPVYSRTYGFSASVGGIGQMESNKLNNIDFAGHVWKQFDQMVFLGVGSGVQQFGNLKSYPTVASAMVRLPFGGQLLSFLNGEWGYDLGDKAQAVYRLGGGLDLKNGDRSSLMAFAGYQKYDKERGYMYVRLGLLLEF